MKGLRGAAIAAFVALLLLQLVLVSLPNTLVARIRDGVSWIGQPINWFEANLPWFSVIHFVIFTLLGLVAHFALPRFGFFRLLTLLLAIAVLGEAVQWLVPGRNPGMADLLADVVGGLLGLGVVFLGVRLRRRLREQGAA